MVLAFPTLAVAQMDNAARATTIRALQAAIQGKWTYAESQIARVHDPLAEKIFYWTYYTQNKGPFPFNRIASFIRQIPDWPQQTTLRLAAENSITDATPAVEIVRWFNAYPPKTVGGMAHYLDALSTLGETREVAEKINAWWGAARLTPGQQDYFLQNYGRVLSLAAHKRRLGTTLHRGQAADARAIARILGPGYGALVEARLALAAGQSGVDRLLAEIPVRLRDDPGLQLARLHWALDRGDTFAAMKILHNPPPRALLADPDAWWRARNSLTRALIEDKQYKSAYLLVAAHDQTKGESFAEAEFLSGWLAFRFLQKPWEGFLNFRNLYNNSTTPITRARAAYWAGRTSTALKYPKIARQWYEASASYPTTFYGQMALAALGRQNSQTVSNPPIPLPVRAAFERDILIQAARIFHHAGDQDDADSFLRAYAATARTQAEFYLAAGLAQEWQSPADSVAIARKASRKGIIMAEYAFPTMLARMKSVTQEWALIHGMIRQESAFNTKAYSSAGARGLMQLMPSTARYIAHKIGVPYDPDWLTSRPDYNIKLGAAYIQKMLDRFDNCYPVALAAYNAGPGRVNQWLKKYGDPCQREVDMIDWIEMIPAAETRNYVQRVLEGVYIYRQKFKNIQHTQPHKWAPLHAAYAEPFRAAQ